MLNFRQKEMNSDDLKVKEYINKYIKELQRHFDVSDSRMRNILLKVYNDLSPFQFVKTFVKKSLGMLKSLYRKTKYKVKGRRYGN